MSLKKNLLANYLGHGWASLMGFVFIPLYIKYLGVESYGLIGFYAILQAWLPLLDLGMTPTLSREMARFTAGTYDSLQIRDLLRTIEAIAFAIAFFIVILVGFSSNWLAVYWLNAEVLPENVVSLSIVFMGAVAALRFVEGIYRSSLLGLQCQVAFNALNSAVATLRGGGAVLVLMFYSPTIQVFFVWQVFVSVLSVFFLALTTYFFLPSAERSGRFSLFSLRGVWRFAGGMVLTSFLVFLLTQVDKILLSKLLTLSEYGNYALAAVVASAIGVLVTPVSQAWAPRLCQLQASGDEVSLAHKYHLGAQLVSVILGSTGMVLAFFSETFLLLWTQDAVLSQNTSALLTLLVLGNLINGLMWIPYQAQLAYGWPGLTVRINVMAVLIVVPAILWVTPRYGAVGAASVWVGLNLSYFFIGAHFMFRRILVREKWIWYIEDVLRPLTVSLIVVGTLKVFFSPLDESIFYKASVLFFASIFTLTLTALSAKKVATEIFEHMNMVRLKIKQQRNQW